MNLHWTGDSRVQAYLSDVHAHRWLGTIWASILDLPFRYYRKAPLVWPSTLVGLVSAHVLPRPTALEFFDIKVESII